MNFMVCKLYFNKAILRKLSKKQENLYKLGTEEELLEHTSTTNKREKKSSMGLCNKVTTEKEVQEVFATDLVMNFYAWCINNSYNSKKRQPLKNWTNSSQKKISEWLITTGKKADSISYHRNAN